jgi:hypothetical protein
MHATGELAQAGAGRVQLRGKVRVATGQKSGHAVEAPLGSVVQLLREAAALGVVGGDDPRS